MKDAMRIMFIPIVGSIGVALIFLLIIWGAGLTGVVVNPEGDLHGKAATEIAGMDHFGPTNACAALYDPVCAFDGNTYDNACQAVSAGTKVKYNGICKS
ncbi:MAG: Kazal-type serine protease inhibitor [Candidatus Woesearchaeota archaeon]|nr:Kazal-type serine protease inhibitor [Candidatus Woesearchaeota archaeon]